MKTKHKFLMPLNVGFFEAVIRQFIVICLPWAIVFANFYFLIPVMFYLETTCIGRFCVVKYVYMRLTGQSVKVTDPWLKDDLLELREVDDEEKNDHVNTPVHKNDLILHTTK